jgi:NAD(P)-dependent dehydrogenase (short-subunit alcohol dehydrogenase family)
MTVLDQLRLDGKVALVTGGSQGLGFGMAQALAQAGADIAIVARREDRLAAAKVTLAETGRRVLTISADLNEADSAQEIVAQTVSEYGRLDILVANAGMTIRQPALDLTPDEWDAVMNINLRSVFFTAQAAARQFIAQDDDSRGKIILLASLTSVVALPHVVPYVASKGGIALMVKALALEWAAHHINVNAIGPGVFHTELNDAVFNDPDRMEKMYTRIPFGRTGTPDELGGAVVFLASPASDYVTGQIVYVDGGYLTS